MELLNTDLGNKKLCYGGYMYTKKYVKSNRIRWECSKRRSLGCKGAATSNLLNEDIRESVLHSHEPDNMSVEIEKLKARMKDRIKSSGARPSQVLAEVLHSSAELIAEMGKIESLKRNLRRQKKQATNIICEPDTLNLEEYNPFDDTALDYSEGWNIFPLPFA